MPDSTRRPRTRGGRPYAGAGLLLALALAIGMPSSVASPVDAAHAGEGPTPEGAIATLRVEDQGSRWLVWADNRLAGPAEVMVDFTESRNVSAQPALPARATLPAGGTRVVAVIGHGGGGGRPRFRLQARSIPGQPGTRPEDVLYRLPVDATAVRVDQGYGGAYSHHDDENRYAIDLAVPEGTPVLAARDGVVMQVGPRDGRGGPSGNFVRLLHDDGSMSLYAHLQPGGALATPGRRVRAGERIGLSGSTGHATGPHLHFAVQANRGMRLVSLPFRMDGLPGSPGQAAEEGLRTRSGP